MKKIRSEEWFTIEAHRLIWRTIQELAVADQPVDTLTVPERLRMDGSLNKVGGIAYVLTLAESVPTAAHIEYYLRIITRMYTARRVIQGCQAVTATGYDVQEEDVPALIAEVQALALSVGTELDEQRHFISQQLSGRFLERTMSALESGERTYGLPTGFRGLDQVTTGFRPGRVYIVAGRASIGKTSLCLAMSLPAARKGRSVAIFSTEMHPDDLWDRWLATESYVDYSKIQTLDLSEEPDESGASELERVLAASNRMGELKLTVYNAAGMTVHDIRMEVRRLQAQGLADLVIVDYLQQVEPVKPSGSRENDVAQISRSFKRMALSGGFPLVLLSQVNRKNEDRGNKRPQLSDLRESGSIEQDADVVLMVYRHGYYEEQELNYEILGQSTPTEAEVIVVKNRFGPKGTIRIGFVGRYMRFCDVDHRHEPAGGARAQQAGELDWEEWRPGQGGGA